MRAGAWYPKAVKHSIECLFTKGDSLAYRCKCGEEFDTLDDAAKHVGAVVVEHVYRQAICPTCGTKLA